MVLLPGPTSLPHRFAPATGYSFERGQEHLTPDVGWWQAAFLTHDLYASLVHHCNVKGVVSQVTCKKVDVYPGNSNVPWCLVKKNSFRWISYAISGFGLL